MMRSGESSNNAALDRPLQRISSPLFRFIENSLSGFQNSNNLTKKSIDRNGIEMMVFRD